MLSSLKEQLHRTQQELKEEQDQVESLTMHMVDVQSKNEELSNKLYSVKQEVCHTCTVYSNINYMY